MPLGPVFNAELLTTARRPRYYVVRFVYGLIILFQVYLSYQANASRYGDGRGNLRIRDMAGFGQEIFITFAVVQAVVVLLLTPALVAGAIADERQRKTLHYLLTSELTGAEIVLGKLAARILHVVVLVALGLPVVSLIGLFGGVDIPTLLLTYAATLTTIYFLSTASILASVVSRRPREAISLIYVLELVWIFVPTMLIYFMPRWDDPWPAIASWANPALQYAAITSPLYLTSPMAFTGAGGMFRTAAWGMGLQVAYGTAFVVAAALLLRPTSRNDGATPRWSRRLARLADKRSWFPRSPCGDDAMMWKETHVARSGGLTRAALVLLGVSLVGVIGYSAFGYVVPAIDEMWADGYLARGTARRDLNVFLRIVSTCVYALWMLGIAASSATGLTGEREEDQWTSLTSTPLSGPEILRAKMIGPVWGLRLVAYLLMLMWAVGLAVGSIHPLGLLACVVEFAVFTWFLTALGTTLSLRSRNSTRALAATMSLLIFLNGGYLFCCIPFQPNNTAIAAGSTPFLFAVSLMSFQDYAELWVGQKAGEVVAACILGVLFYGFAAAGLTSALFTSFDAVVDRPDRFRQDRTPDQEREYRAGREKEVRYPDETI